MIDHHFRIWSPNGCTIDSTGNVFISNFEDCVIVKLTPEDMITSGSTGSVAVGQSGLCQYQNGVGSEAQLENPSALASAPNDEFIYISDSNIRRMQSTFPYEVVSFASLSFPVSLATDATYLYAVPNNGLSIYRAEISLFNGSSMLPMDLYVGTTSSSGTQMYIHMTFILWTIIQA